MVLRFVNLSRKYNKNNTDLYRDHGLKIVDYLVVAQNISEDSCNPFHKPNSQINYIHWESNHPPSIIKQLPLSAKSGSLKLSSDEYILIQATSVYQ